MDLEFYSRYKTYKSNFCRPFNARENRQNIASADLISRYEQYYDKSIIVGRVGEEIPNYGCCRLKDKFDQGWVRVGGMNII